MQGIGFAIVGGIQRVLRVGAFNPRVIELEEAAIDHDIADYAQQARIRAAIERLDTNYVGQEGRGAARDIKARVVAILDREWSDG